MKKLFIAAFFAPLTALAQTYPSPTFNSVTLINPLTSANGGTGTTTSTGSGSVVLGTSPTITSPTIGGTFTATGLVKTTDLATLAANTVIANATGSTASPTAFAMPTCNSATSALNWVPGSGFSCNSSVTAGAFSGILPIANGGTGLAAMGTGVATGLGTAVNTGSGFVTYAQHALSGAGITPYAYAAIGNGVADDTTALQNWLNASASAGQTAFCSAGTYKITKTLNVTATALRIQGPQGLACAITPAFPAGATVSGAAAGATYSGTPSIRLTVSTTANMGAAIEAFGIAGTTEANGAWPSVVIDATHVDIVGPTFVHAWTSGGTIALPVLAVNPTTVSASQPNIDLSGIYFAPPSSNAAATDVAIITGPPAGSNAVFHDFVANGYRRGLMFYNSFAPIIKNAYFYNGLGAAIVANQDISFSNARVDHVEFFSNGNTNLEPSVIIGGANWVENPTFFNSQWSGNNSGALNFAGNVYGATVIGNYLENNTAYNFSCTGSNNNGATITGNFFAYNSGTNNTSLAACGGVMFSGNFLVNQSFSFGGNSQIPATNSFSGTSAITYPIVTPSSIVSSTVTTQAISSATATNVTSVSLPAGNWACTGSTWTNPAGTTTQSYNVAALSTTSLGFPGTAPGEVIQTASVPVGTSIGQNVGPVYYTLPSATTLYLVSQVNYATSTLTINGDIHCLRIF